MLWTEDSIIFQQNCPWHVQPSTRFAYGQALPPKSTSWQCVPITRFFNSSALSQTPGQWITILWYLFPLHRMLPKLIHKILNFKGGLIIVTPMATRDPLVRYNRAARFLPSTPSKATPRTFKLRLRVFKSWLPKNLNTITHQTVSNFFLCLFNDRNVAPQTLMSYKSDLKDPL